MIISRPDAPANLTQVTLNTRPITKSDREELLALAADPDPVTMRRARVMLMITEGETLGNRPELFGYVEVWRISVREPETAFARMMENKALAQKNLKRLWIGCGKQDTLISPENAEALSKWMTEHGVKSVWRTTESGQQWPVWRLFLSEFLPLVSKGE